MKILHIDYDDLKNPWAAGGQARGTFEICRRLVKMGHNVTVVTSAYPGSKDEVCDGVKYHRIGGGGGFTSFIRFILSLPRVVKKYDYDLLVENFTVPISTAFTPLFTKKPVVGYASNLFAREMSRKYKLPFFLVEKIGCKFYDAFVALAESTKDKLSKINRKAEIAVIPRGIDQGFFHKYNPCPQYLLYIGRIDIDQKGLDLLLRAFAKISFKFPKTDLVIAGSGKKVDFRKLEKITFKNKIRDKVLFVGNIRGEDKQKLINAAYAVCIPSRYETFGNTALEAAAAGKPAVIFDIPGFCWTNNEAVLKIKPFSVSEYSLALEKIINSPDLRKEVFTKAQAFAKNFCWDEIAKKHEEFYLSILAKSSK